MTKIKQSLDEVNITIETCEFGRSENLISSGGWQSLTAPKGKYNFIDKIIDGITVTINTVNVKFNSPAFTASVQVNFIELHFLLRNLFINKKFFFSYHEYV